jgi:hypothetical protein
VRVTVNGHTFTGRIGRMGGETLLGFNKAVRQACGVAAGDEIEALVILERRIAETLRMLAEDAPGSERGGQLSESASARCQSRLARSASTPSANEWMLIATGRPKALRPKKQYSASRLRTPMKFDRR